MLQCFFEESQMYVTNGKYRKIFIMRAEARIIFLGLLVLCYMTNLDEKICRYIYNEWILKSKSQRSFAIEHNIEEVTVRKIKGVALEGKKYSVPVETVGRICEARGLKLGEFFRFLDL